MRNAEIVTLMIDEVEVVGIVTCRTAGDFNIEIIKPYQNLTSGAHIPALGRGRFSFNGDYGDKRIREELRGLFSLGKYLADNLESLKNKFDECHDTIAQLSSHMGSEEKYRDKRTELRKRLRSGELSQPEYHHLLYPYLKKRDLLRQIAQSHWDSFFEANFPEEFYHGVNEEVMDILSGKMKLLNQSSRFLID